MAAKRVLDLDLDFFLNPFTASREPGRQRDEDFTPWEENDVRRFLEEKCRLKQPIPGRSAETHDAAFDCWNELTSDGFFDERFELVHVDAHADLGSGDPCFNYVHEELLHLPVEERDPRRTGVGRMHEGNYLTFALARRWISRVDFVFNLDTPFLDQFPDWAFKDYDWSSQVLQLKKLKSTAGQILRFAIPRTVLDLEPDVPCGFYREDKYAANKDFDFFFLSRSPNYTPPASDKLIPIIQDYMTPV